MINQLRPAWTVKAIIVILLSSILFRCVTATNHTVGGPTGWGLTSDVKNWASNTSFFTGDNLVFVYRPEHDVIEVEEQGYAQCQIRSPIRTHNAGTTVIPLTYPGTRYFVCGKPGHCLEGLKLQVDVLPSPEIVSSTPSTETVSDAVAPIGSVEGPEAHRGRHRRRPPRSPRRYPPPSPSHDVPQLPPSPDDGGNGEAPEVPSTNGALVERGWVDFPIAYLVYYYNMLLLIKTIANYYPLL
ncbi:hypothetical protein NE237_020150 [Protea cynaroides]|uniref:Phytocyanin domain-containing protein n=1 Tax=Protea cynaroides TaxID=273540 RepID=A0A9Q0H6P4_9MAGN|nr:hypothetical protein NE237_020150 [Protea cynaroides]